jgi:hypothetical protein
MYARSLETVHKTYETVRQAVIRRGPAFFDSGGGCFESLV